MNRRAISILAVLAMFCTMFTFAMPAIAETTELALNFPKYADHANHSGQTEWLIQDAADWKAMMATADAAAAGAEYFKGHTFHLTDDVDFSQTEWLAPMGEGKYFSGTINGHGNGFNDLKIYEGNAFGAEYKTASTERATGMFQRLGNCTFIDFGVNSGCVVRAEGGATTAATTFGGLVDGYKPTFTRIWSGMVLRHTDNGTVCGLAAPATGNYKENISVNGFVFDAKIFSTSNYDSDNALKTRHGFALVGRESTGCKLLGKYSYINVIADVALYSNTRTPAHPQLNGVDSLEAGAVSAPNETPATESYSSLFYSEDGMISKSTFENLYIVSGPNVVSYFGRGSDTRSTDKTMMANSALEAAWKTNKNPSASAAPVYFTLKNGKIRPTTESENMIIKVTLTGIKDEVRFLNANTEYDLAENDLQKFEIKEGSCKINDGKLVLGKEDVTIEVTADCDHTGSVATGGENANEHTRVCATCGYNKAETCSAQQNCTFAEITEEQLASGEKATHSGTCDSCGEAFTVACDVEYVLSAEANKEAYWDYSACPCGRENVEHTNTALVLSGDATGDDKIDLLDAVRILKKSVQSGEVEKERNADVDGDNAIQPLDALLAIRIWFGNKEAIKQADATAARINAENLFNSNAVTEHNLKMDGTEGNVAGYVVSNPIAIRSGEKLAFGPVRLTAPVMGYFYDAEGKPLQLINHTNVKVESTFEEGKVLASIDVPAGAETVRFQMAEEEARQFYLRTNTDITGMDYEKRFEGKVENPLYGRTFLTVGDSLCAAANDPTYNGLRGWAQRIRDTFGADVTNSSKGGSTLSTAAWKSDGGSETQYIYQQLNKHSGSASFDYIMLEGGVNDHRQHTALYVKDPVKNMAAPIGEIVEDSYDPADFDSENTMAGGMERLIYKAIKDHGDTAALGYIALYEMYTHSEFSNAIPYLDMAMRICEKWGIPYVDFYNDPPEGFNPAKDAHTNDNCHAVSDGYDLMQPRINELCLEMRPVSKEIYDAVMATTDANALDGKKIIFIGNSHTYYGKTVLEKSYTVLTQEERANDKGFFYQLCKENGADVSVTNWTFGGHDFTDLFGDAVCTEKTACKDNNVKHEEYLVDRNYDYVVMQRGSKSLDDPDFMGTIERVMGLFKEENPDTKFVLLIQNLAHTPEEYPWLAEVKKLEEMGVIIVDWGAVVSDIINGDVTVPGANQTYNKDTFVVNQSDKDGYHPNMLSGYITTLMTYCAITGESAVGQDYSFCSDTKINSAFDVAAYITKYYKNNNYDTTFDEVLGSASDMKGIQILIDKYLNEKAYRNYDNPYKDSLKILAIGNSFSQDATVYFWRIADSYGVKNVVVENLSIGGCSLDKHYANITNNTAGYDYYKWTTANGGESVNGKNKSIAQALAEEDWDIITLQQASDQNLVFDTEGNPYDPSGNPVDTYSNLGNIINYLQENEPNAKLLWHMTWAYGVDSDHKGFQSYGRDQMVMYNSLLDRAQELTEKHTALEGVLPSGTAIQNLRGFGIPDSADSGATITRDGYHLNRGIGRYTAALTWYCYITGADPRKVNGIPNNDYTKDIVAYRDEIVESVYNAIQNPYNE